jgi:hypothetical protein
MGNRRQRSASGRGQDALEDVADIVSAAANAMRSGDDLGASTQRRLEKEEKRRRSELRQRRDLLGVGAGLLAGGLAASAGLLTPAAVGVGLLTGGGLAYALKAWDERIVRPPRAQRREAPRLIDPSVAGDDPRSALIRSVITQAMGHLRTVDTAAGTVLDLETAAVLTRIAAIGGRICQAVADQPSGFDAAQRALTYHAEKAAQLSEMAASPMLGADGTRLANVRRVLSRMERLFQETEAALKAEDRRDMDLDLKLIDQALDEDLREPRR